LSWIPYILLGGWVPGKWHGLTLLHSILCVAISFGVIGFFDKKVVISNRARLIILILASMLFVYEGIFNYFFQNGQGADISQFRQFALLQLSFLIGILIKTFNPEAEMD
jgi:UDP-N-acetylmuramyl pentapeptide phosphotransferase/UDP-N-acetylglucosamine-1-phosphate transferase